MAKQPVITRKRRGPAPTGKGTLIGVRLQPDQLAALDTWIGDQNASMTRPEAIRAMMETILLILAKDTGEKPGEEGRRRRSDERKHFSEDHGFRRRCKRDGTKGAGAGPNPEWTEYEMLSIDEWIALQNVKLERPEAIRRLVEIGLRAKKWTAAAPTDDQRLRDLAQLGVGLSEIAAQMNRSLSVIRRHVEKLKITIARGQNGMTVSRLVELGLRANSKPWPMPFSVKAYLDEHMTVETETANEAFAKAVEWHVVERVTDVSISDGIKS